uniref:Amino acid permease/ SLC12A domain-containing protein n=1 Tax=Paramoeba aestuarina TaxID=180227 RepID=A0A7S4JFZ7_9EUKA
MWVLTGFFNFSLCLLSFATLPANRIILPGNVPNDQLLAEMGGNAAGKWLETMVSVDALLVLSGAVLTSYVGVLGLVRRMALDRCLPQFLLRRNEIRDTNHFIIVGFFLLTSSLLILVDGQTTTIAGVYTIAFLGVMCFFTVSAMLLKFKRSKLPREAEASWSFVIFAFILVFMGMIGNIIEYPENFLFFCLYFAAGMIVVWAMLARTTVLKGIIYFLRFTPLRPYCESWLKKKVRDVRNIKVVFFAKIPDLRDMNKAVLYVRENEITSSLKIVHFLPDLSHTPVEWSENVKILDTMYPDLKIDLVLVEGSFCPAHVTSISTTLNVPKNFMFMTCPSDAFRHNLSSFGGVRIIIQGS